MLLLLELTSQSSTRRRCTLHLSEVSRFVSADVLHVNLRGVQIPHGSYSAEASPTVSSIGTMCLFQLFSAAVAMALLLGFYIAGCSWKKMMSSFLSISIDWLEVSDGMLTVLRLNAVCVCASLLSLCASNHGASLGFSFWLGRCLSLLSSSSSLTVRCCCCLVPWLYCCWVWWTRNMFQEQRRNGLFHRDCIPVENPQLSCRLVSSPLVCLGRSWACRFYDPGSRLGAVWVRVPSWCGEA